MRLFWMEITENIRVGLGKRKLIDLEKRKVLGSSSFRYGWIKKPNIGDVPIPYWIICVWEDSVLCHVSPLDVVGMECKKGRLPK